MIDPLTVVTNGILASDSNFIIADPLGYYVIRIEEVIEEVPVSSGGIIPSYYEEVQPKYRKRIWVRVYKGETVFFEKSVEVDDVDVKINDVKLKNNVVQLRLSNPTVKSTTTEQLIHINVEIPTK